MVQSQSVFGCSVGDTLPCLFLNYKRYSPKMKPVKSRNIF